MTAHPPIPYLGTERVTALLPPRAALEAIQGFFAVNRREEVAAPRRIHLEAPGQETVGLYMPAATSRYIGIKIVHLMPRRRPAVEAEIFLYDAESGRLLFWGDGKPLTGLRTAAVSAAASLRIRPALGSLLVYGAGVQAAAHITAFAEAYPDLGDISAAARSPESFARLRARLGTDLAGRVRHCPDPGTEPARADCIVTATPATAPLFAWEAAGPAAHIVAVGSVTAGLRELPPAAFLSSRVYVDTPAALAESGDCHAAAAAGWEESKLAGDLFDLLGGDPPTLPMSGPTLFKSVGQAAQDLALLIRLWKGINTLN